jgi:hypothetical protein
VDTEAPEAAPVLADLVAAGLVSHEMIGDPARIGGEAAALAALCRIVAGPVWRLGPYHYAFRAGPADLGGDLAGLAPAERTAALAAALADALGADAAWLAAVEEPAAAPAALAAPLALVRAYAEAAAEALAPAGPEVQAVINARFAADCARLAAGAEPGTALDARLAEIEARTEAVRAAQAQAVDALAALVARLDAEAAARRADAARADMVAERLAELAAIAGHPAAFTETLGLTLAEFLARLEGLAEAAPARVQAG